MAQDLAWLSASLFCGKDHWNVLLSKGINPFINCLLPQKEARSFHVQFSYASGENIRLAMQTEAEQAKELAKRMDNYFKDYFSKANFPEKEIQFPVEGVFMPFPANSIQYGLYKLDQSSGQYALDECNFQSELSLLMIEALGEETIDEETILTFAFYLHVSCLKTIIDYFGLNEEWIQLYDQKHVQMEGQLKPEIVSQKFEDNRQVLLEIARDIMEFPQPSVHYPAWLAKWLKLCEAEVRSALGQDISKENQIQLIHHRISQFIQMHLGVTENMRLLLFYFISHVSSVLFRQSQE